MCALRPAQWAARAPMPVGPMSYLVRNVTREAKKKLRGRRELGCVPIAQKSNIYCDTATLCRQFHYTNQSPIADKPRSLDSFCASLGDAQKRSNEQWRHCGE